MFLKSAERFGDDVVYELMEVIRSMALCGREDEVGAPFWRRRVTKLSGLRSGQELINGYPVAANALDPIAR